MVVDVGNSQTGLNSNSKFASPMKSFEQELQSNRNNVILMMNSESGHVAHSTAASSSQIDMERISSAADAMLKLSASFQSENSSSNSSSNQSIDQYSSGGQLASNQSIDQYSSGSQLTSSHMNEEQMEGDVRPRSKSFTKDRAERNFIPTCLKDTNYWNRRYKNNMAAKKSREKKKKQEGEVSDRVKKLEAVNTKLQEELIAIKKHFNLPPNQPFDLKASNIPDCNVTSSCNPSPPLYVGQGANIPTVANNLVLPPVQKIPLATMTSFLQQQQQLGNHMMQQHTSPSAGTADLHSHFLAKQLQQLQCIDRSRIPEVINAVPAPSPSPAPTAYITGSSQHTMSAENMLPMNHAYEVDGNNSPCSNSNDSHNNEAVHQAKADPSPFVNLLSLYNLGVRSASPEAKRKCVSPVYSNTSPPPVHDMSETKPEVNDNQSEAAVTISATERRSATSTSPNLTPAGELTSNQDFTATFNYNTKGVPLKLRHKHYGQSFLSHHAPPQKQEVAPSSVQYQHENVVLIDTQPEQASMSTSPSEQPQPQNQSPYEETKHESSFHDSQSMDTESNNNQHDQNLDPDDNSECPSNDSSYMDESLMDHDQSHSSLSELVSMSYKEKRQKNNAAARKCREQQKVRGQMLEQQLQDLQQLQAHYLENRIRLFDEKETLEKLIAEQTKEKEATLERSEEYRNPFSSYEIVHRFVTKQCWGSAPPY